MRTIVVDNIRICESLGDKLIAIHGLLSCHELLHPTTELYMLSRKCRKTSQEMLELQLGRGAERILRLIIFFNSAGLIPVEFSS